MANPHGGARSGAAVLPSSSDRGVEDSALVGRVLLSAGRAPRGFHWIVPGRLAGCAQPGLVSPLDYDLDLLAQVGITYLVTLTEQDLDQQALARHGLRNLHLPIVDREAPTLAQAYMMAFRLQRLLDQGEQVAVHCKAGIGRTGTVLALWLIREGGLSATSALERLRAISPAYVQTLEQEQMLQAFENDILLRL